jgi:hypothetical protein
VKNKVLDLAAMEERLTRVTHDVRLLLYFN